MQRIPGVLSNRARRGFTLVELLTVITILVVLAAVVAPVALKSNEGRKIRDASQTLQASLVGARTLAAATGRPAGIRFLLADLVEANPMPLMGSGRYLFDSFQYIQMGTPFTDGTARVVHTDWPTALTNATLPNAVYDRVVLRGADGNNLFNVLPKANLVNKITGMVDVHAFGTIRFGKAGPIYSFRATQVELTDTNGPFLILDQSLPLPIPGYSAQEVIDANSSYYDDLNGHKANFQDEMEFRSGTEYEIPRGTVPIPENDQIVALPDGIYIDLLLCQVQQANSGFVEIMFSPNGQVVNEGARLPTNILWLRDENADVELKSRDPSFDGMMNPFPGRLVRRTDDGLNRLIAVFSRTGNVEVYQPYFQTYDVGDLAGNIFFDDLDNAADAGRFFDQRLYYESIKQRTTER